MMTLRELAKLLVELGRTVEDLSRFEEQGRLSVEITDDDDIAFCGSYAGINYSDVIKKEVTENE